MININFIFKIFTYFLKFFFFPVSILSTYFFDFFNLDLFNQKKVVELTNQINELKELNSIQNKELKNNSSLLKQNVVQSYDIKNILIYSAGIITTCIIIFGIYSFFNNGDSAFGFITENSAQNAHRVVEDIKIQSQLSNGVNHDLSDNTLQVIGAVGTETISTLTGVAETISTNSNIQSTESVGLALETINSNLTNINNGLNLQIANVVNYIQANVAQKLNRIDITLVKSVEMLML